MSAELYTGTGIEIEPGAWWSAFVNEIRDDTSGSLVALGVRTGELIVKETHLVDFRYAREYAESFAAAAHPPIEGEALERFLDGINYSVRMRQAEQEVHNYVPR